MVIKIYVELESNTLRVTHDADLEVSARAHARSWHDREDHAQPSILSPEAMSISKFVIHGD